MTSFGRPALSLSDCGGDDKSPVCGRRRCSSRSSHLHWWRRLGECQRRQQSRERERARVWPILAALVRRLQTRTRARVRERRQLGQELLEMRERPSVRGPRSRVCSFQLKGASVSRAKFLFIDVFLRQKQHDAFFCSPACKRNARATVRIRTTTANEQQA